MRMQRNEETTAGSYYVATITNFINVYNLSANKAYFIKMQALPYLGRTI